MTPYERVRLSRERTAGTFPFPALRPCIDYAICEFGGEYRDALLRDERSDDKRNTDRRHDARAELGDSFYMLLSACIQADHEPEFKPVVTMTRRRRCNEIVRYLTHADDDAERIENGQETERAWDVMRMNFDYAYSNMVAIAASYGWPVDALIDDTCNAFERKHGAVAA